MKRLAMPSAIKYLVLAFIATTATTGFQTGPAHGAAPLEVSLGDSWSLGVSAQLRPRAVIHSGLDLVPGGVGERHHITQRTRLGVQLEEKTGWLIKVVVQDIRTWGEEGNIGRPLPTLNDDHADGLDLQEAFAVLQFTKQLSLKLGRQEVNLDNHRLVGNVGWSQRARSFDAARLNFKHEQIDASLMYSKVQEGKETRASHVSDLDGHVPPGRGNIHFGALRVAYQIQEKLMASFTYLLNAVDNNDHTRHTAGLFGKGSFGDLSFTAEFYYQFGSVPNVATNEDESIGAWLGALGVGYKLASVPTKPFIKVWGELLSGDSDGNNWGVFETPYPTNHKFYGELDYFLAIGANTGNRGLMDIGGRIGFHPLDKTTFYVDFHQLGNMTEDANGETTFGQEINVKLIVNVLDNVSFRAFYGIMLPDQALLNVRQPGVTQTEDKEHLFYLTTDVKI